jgi:hypothetical protein
VVILKKTRDEEITTKLGRYKTKRKKERKRRKKEKGKEK